MGKMATMGWVKCEFIPYNMNRGFISTQFFMIKIFYIVVAIFDE